MISAAVFKSGHRRQRLVISIILSFTKSHRQKCAPPTTTLGPHATATSTKAYLNSCVDFGQCSTTTARGFLAYDDGRSLEILCHSRSQPNNRDKHKN